MKDNDKKINNEFERDLYDEIFNSDEPSMREALEAEFGGEDGFLMEFNEDNTLLDVILDGEEFETPFDREQAKKELIKIKKQAEKRKQYREKELEQQRLQNEEIINKQKEWTLSQKEIQESNSSGAFAEYANSNISEGNEYNNPSYENPGYNNPTYENPTYESPEYTHNSNNVNNKEIEQYVRPEYNPEPYENLNNLNEHQYRNVVDNQNQNEGRQSGHEKQEERERREQSYRDEFGITALNEQREKERIELEQRKSENHTSSSEIVYSPNKTIQEQLARNAMKNVGEVGITVEDAGLFRDHIPNIIPENSFKSNQITYAALDGKTFEQKREDTNIQVNKSNYNNLHLNIDVSSKAGNTAQTMKKWSNEEKVQYERHIRDERLHKTAVNIAARSEAIRAVDEKRKLYSKYDNIKDVRDNIGHNIKDASTSTGRVVKQKMESAYSESLGANMERRHLPLVAASRASITLIATSHIPIQSIANKFVSVDKAKLNPTNRNDFANFKNIAMKDMRLNGIAYNKLPGLHRKLGKDLEAALKAGKFKLAENISKQMADINSVLKVTGTGRKGNKLSKTLNKRSRAWKALRTAPISIARQSMMAGGDPFASGITIVGDIKAYGKQGMKVVKRVSGIGWSGVKAVGRITKIDKQLVKVGGKLSNKLIGDNELRYLKMFTREEKYNRKLVRMSKSPIRKVSNKTVTTTKKVTTKAVRSVTKRSKGVNKTFKYLGKVGSFLTRKINAAQMMLKQIMSTVIAIVGSLFSAVIGGVIIVLIAMIAMSTILAPQEQDISKVASYLTGKQKAFVTSVNNIKNLESDDTTVVFETDLKNMLDNRREILSMAAVYFNNDFSMDWFQDKGLTDTNYKHYVSYLFDVSHQVSQTSKFETRKRTEERANLSYRILYEVLNKDGGMDEINEFYLNNGFKKLSNGNYYVRKDVQFKVINRDGKFKIEFEYEKKWTEIITNETTVTEKIQIPSSYCKFIKWEADECWETIIIKNNEDKKIEKSEIVKKSFDVNFTAEEIKKLRYEVENNMEIILKNDGTKFSVINTIPYEHHIISVNVDVKRFPEIFAADTVGTVHGSTPKLKLTSDIVLGNLLKARKYNYVGKNNEVHEGGIYAWKGLELAKIIDSIYKVDENGLKVILDKHSVEGTELWNKLTLKGTSLEWVTSKNATPQSNSLLKEILNTGTGQNVQKEEINRLISQKIDSISSESDSDVVQVFLADVMIEKRLTGLDMDLRKVIKMYKDNEPKSPKGIIEHYKKVYSGENYSNRDYSINILQGRLGDLDGTSETAFIYPLEKLAPVTGEFGPRVQPDVEGGVNLTNHKGIDIRAKMGTELFASIDGVVTRNSWSSCGGNLLEITSTNKKNKVVYKHMQSPSPFKNGTTVTRGQFIGFSGGKANAGDVCTTGPHLHFETHDGGKPVNPRQFIDFGKGPNGDYSGGGGKVWNSEEYPNWADEGGWNVDNRGWVYMIYMQDWKELYGLSSPDDINAPILPIIDGEMIYDDEDADTSSIFEKLISEFKINDTNDKIGLEALKAYSIKYNKNGSEHTNFKNGLNEFGFIKYVLNKSGKLYGNWNDIANGVSNLNEIFLKGNGGDTVDQLQIGDIGFRNNPTISGIANSMAIYIGDGKWISMTSGGVDLRSGSEFLHHYRPR